MRHGPEFLNMILTKNQTKKLGLRRLGPCDLVRCFKVPIVLCSLGERSEYQAIFVECVRCNCRSKIELRRN